MEVFWYIPDKIRYVRVNKMSQDISRYCNVPFGTETYCEIQISQYSMVYLGLFWYISGKIRYGGSQVDISIYLNISVCTICHGTETYRMMRVTVAAGGQASSVPRIQAQSDSGFDPHRGWRLGAWASHCPSPNAGWACQWVTSHLHRVTVTDIWILGTLRYRIRFTDIYPMYTISYTISYT